MKGPLTDSDSNPQSSGKNAQSRQARIAHIEGQPLGVCIFLDIPNLRAMGIEIDQVEVVEYHVAIDQEHLIVQSQVNGEHSEERENQLPHDEDCKSP